MNKNKLAKKLALLTLVANNFCMEQIDNQSTEPKPPQVKFMQINNEDNQNSSSPKCCNTENGACYNYQLLRCCNKFPSYLKERCCNDKRCCYCGQENITFCKFCYKNFKEPCENDGMVGSDGCQVQ